MDRIVDAILAAPVGPQAREEGARLVEAYVKRAGQWKDTNWRTVSVENLFFLPLAPKTLGVGVVDRIIQPPNQNVIVGCEWKTRRAPKVKKDGQPYKGDTEQDWLEEIKGGVQLATYALAMREGTFMLPSDGGKKKGVRFEQVSPLLLVRAAVKSTPPLIWPSKWEDGLVSFSEAQLDAVKNALVVKAEQIRAARRLGLAPFQLPGYQCRTYGEDCTLLGDCRKQKYQSRTLRAWKHEKDKNPDPGFRVCELLGLDPTDPELVVLSQSAYQTYSTCMEKGHVMNGGFLEAEGSYEMDVGTAYHAGLACFYSEEGK